MYEKLREIRQKFEDLEIKLQEPDLVKRQEEFVRLSKEHAELSAVMQPYDKLLEVDQQIEENTELLKDDDPEMRELAEAELESLKEEKENLGKEIQVLLIPKNPLDGKNTVLEIRAGTGGEEAALFAADLFRMYTRYVERNRWKMEILSSNETGRGGFKEIICLISGKQVYSKLKYESGVHRVQRVPDTETQGRIHTSAVTVAILPEADEVDMKIEDRELRIDVYRSSGPGGQSVNTTDSAVRITHIPTGLVVTCQDEKSQHKNKARAMKILSSRLLDKKIEEQQMEEAENRRSQVGTGDRSERIRTYNFPQNRISDHRIGLTLYKLEQFLDGDLTEMVDQLTLNDQAEALKNL